VRDDRPKCGSRTRICDRCGERLLAARCSCGGKRKPCAGKPLRKLDGSYTKRCRMHGGKNELAAGTLDPAAGGRPISTGLYARQIRDAQRRALLADAPSILGTLDDELAVARTLLADALERYDQNPSGGITVSVGGTSGEGGRPSSVRVRAYADIVGELTDRVRKLELARERLAQSGPTGEDEMLEHEAWLDASRKGKL
jgi:hypothetical protein